MNRISIQLYPLQTISANSKVNQLLIYKTLLRVLDLVAENRAIYDSLMFLEKTFKNEQIDTETLIKVFLN